MGASEISQHFQRDCGYDSARCPKCSTSVLCSDMCTHLKSNCANLATSTAQKCHREPSCKEDTASIHLFRQVVEEQASQMGARLERLVADVGAHGGRLNKICHAINTANEAQTVVLSEAVKECLSKTVQKISMCSDEIKQTSETRRGDVDNLTRKVEALETTFNDDLVDIRRLIYGGCACILGCIQEVKSEAKENIEKTLDRIDTVLRRDERRQTHVVFFITGVKALEKEAQERGWAVYMSEQVYLCGYFLEPGCFLKEDGESVKLHARIRLHRGDMDDNVQSPFEHNIRLTAIHPMEKADSHIEFKAPRGAQRLRRPTTQSNEPGYFPDASLNLCVLTREGYVFEDVHRIKLELLP